MSIRDRTCNNASLRYILSFLSFFLSINDAIVVTVSQHQHQEEESCFFFEFFPLRESESRCFHRRRRSVKSSQQKKSKGRNVTLFVQFTENDHADSENVIVWWKNYRISFFCFFTE